MHQRSHFNARNCNAQLNLFLQGSILTTLKHFLQEIHFFKKEKCEDLSVLRIPLST